MAKLLCGKVYFHEHFAGELQETLKGQITFTYASEYLAASLPAIAHTLPLRAEPYSSNAENLLPFFDNLVSEGWLEQAQTRLMGKRGVTRFALLLAFGFDCAGAVSVIDPEPADVTEALLDLTDPKEVAVLTNRASLSGVQPKLAMRKTGQHYRPARINELSTHIAKFPSASHPDLIENEYLSTLAFKALLPESDVVSLEITDITGFDTPALLIARFDRSHEKGKLARRHFEEFNQLLGQMSAEKYKGSHEQLGQFILQTPGCLPTQAYALYKRILVGILLGNTDMHLKNFAMFHPDGMFRLTPAYDTVAASLYDYKTLALSIANTANLRIDRLKPASIIRLGEGFGLSKGAMQMIIDELKKHKTRAQEAIDQASYGSSTLKQTLISLLEKRWNTTFASTGKALLKKR